MGRKIQECRYGPARPRAPQDATLDPGGPVPQQPTQGVSISMEAEVWPEHFFSGTAVHSSEIFSSLFPLTSKLNFSLAK